MRLAVFSHKTCWISSESASGYATDGGFAFQMRAISELFSSTRLVIPCSESAAGEGLNHLTGRNISVTPLNDIPGTGLRRKINLFFWLFRSSAILVRELRRADAVHTPIPSDIGTVAMLLAFVFRKPLFVRHCGNWLVQKTVAERFWKWFMERFAGGRNVMLATGGSEASPSRLNANIHWIFSTSLSEQELDELRQFRRNLRDGRARLIIACRQEEAKGTGRVIQSLPLILNDFRNATLDVVGDGSALTKFKKVAAELQLSERVTFHGRLDHAGVIRLLQRADLFCFPTTASEGFPKVVLEALACGLPVITTRVSVLPLLIQNGCGLLIEEKTPMAVAQAITKCLADQEDYRRMSAQASATAGQFSLERWRDTIGDFLREAWGPLRSDA